MRRTALFDAGANPHGYWVCACASEHRFSTFLENREQKWVEPGQKWPPPPTLKRRQNRPGARVVWGFAQNKKPTQRGWLLLFGAGEMNRTPDLLITNELLYRLSYTGEASHYI